MGQSPNMWAAACPNCMFHLPTLQRSLTLRYVRLRCLCGVSGPWAKPEPFENPQHAAANAWNRIAAPVQAEDSETVDALIRAAAGVISATHKLTARRYRLTEANGGPNLLHMPRPGSGEQK